MQPNVTVIVPVYNVDEYISKCLDSLITQTLNNLEIIVVNDGSTDNSNDILVGYSEKYKNIIHFSQDNKGLSEARNAGVRLATGEYIAFLDSDDWVEPETYETMYNIAQSRGDDIVCCGFYMAYEDGRPSIKYSSPSSYESVNPLEYPGIFKDVKVAAWDKLYKRAFFVSEGAKYPAGLWYEDTAVSVPLLLKARKVSVIKDAFIHYRQRLGSITKQQTFNRKIFDVYSVYEKVVEDSKDHSNKSASIFAYYFIKKCVIDNFIRLHRYNKVNDHIVFLRKEFYSRYNITDIYSNNLLTIKEKAFSMIILKCPKFIFMLLSKKGV